MLVGRWSTSSSDDLVVELDDADERHVDASQRRHARRAEAGLRELIGPVQTTGMT